MKFETILSACLKATYDAASGMSKNPVKTRRQQAAFRARILRMFDFENNAQKIAIKAYKAVIRQQQQRIAELEKVLDVEYVPKLKKRIAELEEQLMIEKEFGMHYHAEFMKLFKKGIE